MLDVSPLWQALGGLHANVQGIMYMIFMSSIRPMVMFLVLPATSSEVLPGTARAGVVYVMTGFIVAAQSPDQFDNMDTVHLLFLTGKEAFLGLVIGYAASTIFWTAQTVGALVDNIAGFNNVQMTNPQQGEQNTPVSNILLQLTVTLFFVSGGLTVLLGALFDSYRWWPLATTLPDVNAAAADFMIHQGEAVMTIAIKLCAPVVLVLVLVDLGLGIIARAADKLEPSSLSQPIRGIIGVLLLVFLTSAISTQVREALHFSGFGSVISGFTQKTPAATASPQSPPTVTPSH